MEHGNSDAFDVVVIGSGAAGMAAARGAAARGAKVALIEQDQYLGGECPNYACVPTKTLLAAAKTYTKVEHADEVGIHLVDFTLNYAELKRHKDHVVAHTSGRHLTAGQLAADGITLIRGRARLSDQHTVSVGSRRIPARQIVLATGSRPRLPKLEGLESVPYLTSSSAVNLNSQPNSVLILGGGPVGVEFAQLFSAFGTDVTLIDQADRILGRDEPEAAQALAQSLRGYGVRLLPNFTAESVSKTAAGIELVGKDKERSHQLRAEHLLVATGQQPNVDDLGLETIGLHTKPELTVDTTLRTTLPHIWAAGDVVGSMQYTHVAHLMGSVVAHNLMDSDKRSLDLSVIPRVVFTHLELASVGLTEAELHKQGTDVVTGLAPIATLSRALTDGEPDGLVKIVADATSGEILGASIVATRAGEMIHELALAMQLRASVRDVAQLVHAFPTYSEAIALAAHDAVGKLAPR